MGMYNLIEDNVNKFYDVAMEKIGECESFAEFVDKMKEHKNLLIGSSDEDHFEDGLYECWQEKWSKYL